MIVYKLTNEHRQTRDDFQYEIGIPAHATGAGTALCSSGVLHAYETPDQAAFMCPVHCENNQRTLWEAEAPEIVANDGRKVGVKSLTLRRPATLPPLTTEQRIQVAIALAWPCTAPSDPWRTWAQGWLRHTDRSAAAASASADAASAAAAYAAAYAASAAAATAAAYAATAAAAANLCETLRLVLAETCDETATRLETL